MFKERFKYLFLPYFFGILIICSVYSFLHWLLFLKLQIIAVYPEYLRIGIPLVISFIYTWFIYGPKLTVFKTSDKTFDFLRFICWILFVPPLAISQHLTVSMSGEKKDLKSVEELKDSENAKYYTIENYQLNKTKLFCQLGTEYKGKHNEKLQLNAFIIIPITSTEIKDVNTCKAWLGLNYHKEIKSNLSDYTVHIEMEEFANESIKKARSEKHEFTYLEIPDDSYHIKMFSLAIENNKFFTKKSRLVLMPKTGDFESRNESSIKWLLVTLFGTPFIWLVVLSFPKLTKGGIKKLKEGKIKKDYYQRLKSDLDFLVPNKSSAPYLILIYTNIIIFLLLFLTGNGFQSITSTALNDWGGFNKTKVMEGEYWRFITGLFLHGGIMHLMNNMIILFLISFLQLQNISVKRFLILYFLSGIGGWIASLYWNPIGLSVGASGAIMGLEGTLLVFLITKAYGDEFKKINMMLTLSVVILTLLMGLFNNSDNAGHIGGLITGILIGIIYRLNMEPVTTNNQ